MSLHDLHAQAAISLADRNELPKLPAGWSIERFRFLFSESKERNGSKPVGDMLSVSEYHGVTPKIYEHDEQRRSDVELEAYRVVHPGQLVVNSMWLNHLGLGVSNHMGHVSPAYGVYDISPRLNPRFAHHLLRSNFYLRIYKRYLYGIRPNSFQVKANDWSNIPIILPDLPTQSSIADFLDRETAQVDNLMEQKNSLISSLEDSMRTIIVAAVTGSHKGRVPTLRVTNNQRSHFDSVASGWTQRTIRSAIRSYGSKKNEDEMQTVLSLTKNGIKIKTDLAFGKSTESYVGHQMVYPGQMVFTPRDFDATPILCGVSEHIGCISNLYIVFDVADHINPKFLEYYLWGLKYGYEFFSKLSFGMRFSFNKGQFERIPLAHPDRDTQDRIVAELDDKISAIRKVQEKTKLSIEKLKEYRSSLITAAVTGQIDVATWQPKAAERGSPDQDLKRAIA